MNVRILGIDPGTVVLGYGIIELKDTLPRLVELNVLHLQSLPSQQEKLREIFLRVQELIEHHQPTALSIEAPFYGKNAQSMHKLGRAQGVAIAAAILMGLEIHEFSPKTIKKAVTGNGNASKEQVAGMLESLLAFNFNTRHFDATDALAAALCLANQLSTPDKIQGPASSWKKFARQHPDRML
ncbi:MAG: crossover junction endodeoxyribonuclease RuvC [Saprospiraceae bacterium]|jgi:crossover junction endodeoxyribonuclease RuvC|nr:crossover junction endodeoxyribonuclease RuvC [Saprospiraceae bacterium]MBP9209796.1 crossover junction endodeoxyribonuclease RuvC [Saprospiraceae bacterium]MBV6473353.1 Crossover junction endodeoxyribonuclease RuvC [Saprospiraceae bacterium]